MRILGKTSSRPNYLFGLLPHYFKQNDSYKDSNQEGLLERYLEIFCQEIDNEVTPYIDNALYLYDAKNLSSLPNSDPSVFIDYIADYFGNPPDIGTETQYKNLLRAIRLILQTKGTRQSLVYFLALYGYQISSLTESTISPNIYDLTPTALKYDNSLKFDNLLTFYSDWSLVITDMPGTGVKNPSTEFKDNLKLAIQRFISPMFANLTTLTYV